MATPQDLMMASKLITVTPGYLSKWTKAELTSATLALKLFVHELPGGPKLLHRATELAATGGDEGMLKAVEAIRCQEGVDASLYRPAQSAGDEDVATGTDGKTTSTQEVNGASLSWADMTASQIPSAQDGGSSLPSKLGGGGGGGDIPNGKVSDHSSCSVRSLAAPTPPSQLANAGEVGDGLVDSDMNGTGVTRVGGVRGAAVVGNRGGDVDGRPGEAPLHKTSAPWRPRVCNRVWKGKTCKNRSSGCRFAHPDPCNSSKCSGSPVAGCKAFHPRVGGVETSVLGNDRGSARRGSAAPNRNERDSRTSRPTGGRSGSNGGRTTGGSGRKGEGGSRNGGSNNNTRSSNSYQRRPQVSYRDVAARAATSASSRNSRGPQGNTDGNNSGGIVTRGDEGSALGPRLQPGLLEAVVSAVMAVLGEKGLRQECKGEQRRCRC